MNFLNAGSDGEKTEKQNYFEAQIQGLSIQAEKDWKFTSYQAGIRYYKSTGCCSSNKWSNVINRINDKLLPAAINLYKYYQKDKGLEPQYKELLNLVCVGIVKYAKDECNRENEAIHYINQVFQEKHIQVIDGSLLEDFIGQRNKKG